MVEKKTAKKKATKKTVKKAKKVRKVAKKKAAPKTEKKEEQWKPAFDLKSALETIAEEAKKEEPKHKGGRRIDLISRAKKSATLAPKNELDQEFFDNLAKSLDVPYGSRNKEMLDTLGDDTFSDIEKQLADSYLASLRAHRRTTILNKLLTMSYDLVETNLPGILNVEEDNA